MTQVHISFVHWGTHKASLHDITTPGTDQLLAGGYAGCSVAVGAHRMTVLCCFSSGELDSVQVMIDVPQQRSGPEGPGFVVQVRALPTLVS